MRLRPKFKPVYTLGHSQSASQSHERSGVKREKRLTASVVVEARSRNCIRHKKLFITTTLSSRSVDRKGQTKRAGMDERERAVEEEGGDNNKRVPPRLKLFDRQRGG